MTNLDKISTAEWQDFAEEFLYSQEPLALLSMPEGCFQVISNEAHDRLLGGTTKRTSLIHTERAIRSVAEKMQRIMANPFGEPCYCDNWKFADVLQTSHCPVEATHQLMAGGERLDTKPRRAWTFRHDGGRSSRTYQVLDTSMSFAFPNVKEAFVLHHDGPPFLRVEFKQSELIESTYRSLAAFIDPFGQRLAEIQVEIEEKHDSRKYFSVHGILRKAEECLSDRGVSVTTSFLNEEFGRLDADGESHYLVEAIRERLVAQKSPPELAALISQTRNSIFDGVLLTLPVLQQQIEKHVSAAARAEEATFAERLEDMLEGLLAFDAELLKAFAERSGLPVRIEGSEREQVLLKLVRRAVADDVAGNRARLGIYWNHLQELTREALRESLRK
jgi:hypothetical protein